MHVAAHEVLVRVPIRVRGKTKMQGFGAQPVIVADCELQVFARHNILDASSSDGSRPLGVS
jgi:hypothetical protein